MAIPTERRRDGQQWVYDWVVKTTGRPINFEYDDRYFPAAVKSHAMVPKHMGRVAAYQEALARREEAAGHAATAIELYLRAVQAYFQAQHALFRTAQEPLKRSLYERLEACYDRVVALADYPIERIEVPWKRTSLACVLHLLPDRRRAPCVVAIPGMDRAKEHWITPLANVAHQRGMHLLAMDGPGQGSSNLRGNHVTDDNYERAASEVIRHVASRSEVLEQRVGVVGSSMGTFWALRTAALEPAVAALATAAPVFGDMRAIFEQSSPRFKQIFMYMAGLEDDEAAFDAMAARMHTRACAREVTCPTLIISGEFDPLAPIEDVRQVYDDLAGPRELWVLEDEFHGVVDIGPLGGLDVFPFAFDWLADELVHDRPHTGAREVVFPLAAEER